MLRVYIQSTTHRYPCCFTDQQAKTTGDIHRRRKRRYRSAWSRGEIKPKKRRIIEKETTEKREGIENYEAKTEEEEEEEVENKEKVEENGEKSEEEVSVHSTDNSDDEVKRKAGDKQDPTIQVMICVFLIKPFFIYSGLNYRLTQRESACP